jgi:dCMP deaminase
MKKEKLYNQRPNWIDYFLMIAHVVALRSTCLSRKNGAVITKDKRIISTGYNGSVTGVAHCSDEGECFRRSIGIKDAAKYNHCRSIHAEANAIAHMGRMIKDGSMFCTLSPCYTCMKLIRQAGVTTVYFSHLYESGDKERDKLWSESAKDFGILLVHRPVIENQMHRYIHEALTVGGRRIGFTE